jgi:hypothetical protein
LPADLISPDNGATLGVSGRLVAVLKITSLAERSDLSFIHIVYLLEQQWFPELVFKDSFALAKQPWYAAAPYRQRSM